MLQKGGVVACWDESRTDLTSCRLYAQAMLPFEGRGQMRIYHDDILIAISLFTRAVIYGRCEAAQQMDETMTERPPHGHTALVRSPITYAISSSCEQHNEIKDIKFQKKDSSYYSQPSTQHTIDYSKQLPYSISTLRISTYPLSIFGTSTLNTPSSNLAVIPSTSTCAGVACVPNRILR